MRYETRPIQSVENAVVQYVETRGRNGRPVSTADAVRAIRTALSDCRLSDRELGETVARMAIERGLNVSFDGATPQSRASGRKSA